jgi:Zn-dependent protease
MAATGTVIGRVFGIEIRANRSWILVLVLVTLTMASQFDQEYPTWARAATLVAGGISSALFFASVIAHELSHCLVARRFGIQARSISLNFFGGLSWLNRQAVRPIEEFSYSVAGPLANVIIAVVFFAVAYAADGRSEVVEAISTRVAIINAILALFNLIPGAPLDGGRVLRAAVWGATGSYEKGTVVASLAGQALGALIIMGGLAEALAGDLGGLLVGVVGYYLLSRARTSLGELTLRRALAGLTVRNLWLDTLPHVERSATVGELLQNLGPVSEAVPDPHFMVVDEGVLWGLLPASRVMQVDSRQWDTTRVGDMMTPIDKVEKLSFQTDIMRAMEAIYASDMNELPVVDENVVQGFVGRDALLRFVASRLASGTSG